MAFCSFVDRSCMADQSSILEASNMTDQMIAVEAEDVVVALGPKTVGDIYDKLKLCFADKTVKLTGKSIVDQPVNLNLNMTAVIEALAQNQLSLIPVNANPTVVQKAIEGNLPVPTPPALPDAIDSATPQLAPSCPPTSVSDVVIGTPRDAEPIRLVTSLPAMPIVDPVETDPTLSEHSILQGSPAPDADATAQNASNNAEGSDFFQNLQGYFTIMNAMQAIAPLPPPPPNTDTGNILTNFFNLFNATANPSETPQQDPPAAETEASPTRLPWSRRGRRIPCEFCNERFSSREEARIHSETVHIELFQYTCMEENCKKRYKARQGLATHCSKTGHLMPPPNLPSYYSGSR